MMVFFWIVTLLGASAGGFIFMSIFVTRPPGAPQEAALAAIAVAATVIPYVFTRAVEGMISARWREDVLAALTRLQVGDTQSRALPPADKPPASSSLDRLAASNVPLTKLADH